MSTSLFLNFLRHPTQVGAVCPSSRALSSNPPGTSREPLKEAAFFIQTMQDLEQITQQEYKYGFTTDVETDIIPVGLNEDVVRLISAKKGEPE